MFKIYLNFINESKLILKIPKSKSTKKYFKEKNKDYKINLYT